MKDVYINNKEIKKNNKKIDSTGDNKKYIEFQEEKEYNMYYFLFNKLKIKTFALIFIIFWIIKIIIICYVLYFIYEILSLLNFLEEEYNNLASQQKTENDSIKNLNLELCKVTLENPKVKMKILQHIFLVVILYFVFNKYNNFLFLTTNIYIKYEFLIKCLYLQDTFCVIIFFLILFIYSWVYVVNEKNLNYQQWKVTIFIHMILFCLLNYESLKIILIISMLNILFIIGDIYKLYIMIFVTNKKIRIINLNLPLNSWIKVILFIIWILWFFYFFFYNIFIFNNVKNQEDIIVYYDLNIFFDFLFILKEKSYIKIPFDANLIEVILTKSENEKIILNKDIQSNDTIVSYFNEDKLDKILLVFDYKDEKYSILASEISEEDLNNYIIFIPKMHSIFQYLSFEECNKYCLMSKKEIESYLPFFTNDEEIPYDEPFNSLSVNYYYYLIFCLFMKKQFTKLIVIEEEININFFLFLKNLFGIKREITMIVNK